MTASAAVRTGGRGAGADRAVARLRSIRRTATTTVAALLLLAGPGITAASATPLGGAASATAPATGGASLSAADAVRITVDSLEPRTVDPTSVITVSGRLVNTGDTAVTDMSLRLQRGQVMTSRSEVKAADRDPDADTAAVAPFAPQTGRLEPGDSLPFSYSVPASVLHLDQSGVYPVLLNLNGTVDGDQRRVGELDTFVVEPPAAPTGRTAVAWLWPLIDRTHRDAAGHFVDDGLAKEIKPGGRLDRALAAIERLPKSSAPGGGPATPAVPVTLAVDPALVEALQLMAAGPYQVGRANVPGSGTQAAQAFLQRLAAVAADYSVVALPYGDVDADALQAAGVPDALTRSLPGTPAGTAEDGRLRPGPATGGGATPAPATGSPASGTPAAPAPAAGTGAGARILSTALGARVRTDVDWMADGPVSAATLTTLQNGGIGQVVVSADALTGGDRALGLGAGTATALTTVPTATGSLPALVGDTSLGALVDAGHVAGGPRIAEQRYLAELTALSMQAGPDPAALSTVLAIPPRLVDADPAEADTLLTEATRQAWLQPASLADLAAGPAAPAGGLVTGTATGSLDAAGMAEVTAAVAGRNDLATAVTGDPATVLAPYDAAISRTASLEWRGNAPAFRAAAHDLRQVVGQLRDRVALVPPADGTYSLASDNAPLVLTVRNDLPFPVEVLLRLTTRGNEGLGLGDIGRQTLAPGSRTTLQVPTQVRRSGGFTVTAVLTTPDGRPLGAPVQVRVKSTAYGSISLLITIGAAALLGLLFLRRLVRFVLRRRRAGGRPAGPAPEGAAVPLPPTRSPV